MINGWNDVFSAAFSNGAQFSMKESGILKASETVIWGEKRHDAPDYWMDLLATVDNADGGVSQVRPLGESRELVVRERHRSPEVRLAHHELSAIAGCLRTATFRGYEDNQAHLVIESWLIFFGEEHLRSAVGQFVLHYNGFRNHQGMQNKLFTAQFLPVEDEIKCGKRLGALLNYYYRKIA